MGQITGSVTEAADKLRNLQIEAAEAFDAIQAEVATALDPANDAATQQGSADAIALQWGRIWYAGLRSAAVMLDAQAKIANDLLMDETVPGQSGSTSIDTSVGDSAGTS